MKINTLNFNSQNSSINRQICFKGGLPSWFIRETKTANPNRIEAELADKGISADFGGVPTVAMCCKKVVEIMEHYGFELPSKFSFEPLKHRTLGTYSSYQDKVCINSNMKEFQDVVKQNRLEERQGSYHPITGHFLQTYLHEFSHAAHFHNLCNKLGYNRANNVFWGYLSEHSPSDVVVGPLNAFVKSFFKNNFMRNMVNKVIPPTNGLYAKTDLSEYMAEKNARWIAKDLGDNLTLGYNSNLPLCESPDWNLAEELLNNPTSILDFSYCKDTIKQTLEFFDRDIWNGEVDKLESIRNMYYRN